MVGFLPNDIDELLEMLSELNGQGIAIIMMNIFLGRLWVSARD